MLIKYWLDLFHFEGPVYLIIYEILVYVFNFIYLFLKLVHY